MDNPVTKSRQLQTTRTNSEWLAALSGRDNGQDEALKELRGLLLRAALYTLVTNLSDLRELDDRERMALAEDCAQEALMTVLGKLDDFRGESKFTTWAYKFGIHVALTRARRERWKRVSLDALAEDDYSLDWLQWQEGFQTVNSEVSTQQTEVRNLIRDIIRDDLTDRQRQVLKWMVFDEVPMDVVVERLGSNRNAVYKLLHDGRLKVKRRLAEEGYAVGEIYELFRSAGK